MHGPLCLVDSPIVLFGQGHFQFPGVWVVFSDFSIIEIPPLKAYSVDPALGSSHISEQCRSSSDCAVAQSDMCTRWSHMSFSVRKGSCIVRKRSYVKCVLIHFFIVNSGYFNVDLYMVKIKVVTSSSEMISYHFTGY